MLDVRKDFPVLDDESVVYLDTAASSLKPHSVINKMDEYYKEYGVNVHRGVYGLSMKASDEYDEARNIVAKFLNAKSKEIVFTRGASSGLNFIAASYGLNNLSEGDEIITTELEHHSNLLPWINVASKTKATLKYVELNKEGRITVEGFKKVLSDKTKVVAITHVSNTMGYVTPIKEITELAHSVGAIVVVDSAQGVPHKKVDVVDLDVDFLAFSSHKMCGPTGVGVVYGKYNLLNNLEPFEFGGSMMDEVDYNSMTFQDAPLKFEAGTPPIAEAIGLGEAIKYLENIGMENVLNHERELRDCVCNELEVIEGVNVLNKTAETGIILFNLEGVHPHDAISFFEEDNVCTRAGHHCASLMMKRFDFGSSLRASFYIYNNKSDCERFVAIVKKAREFFTEMGF